jgi:hypothetical protein
MVIYSDSNCDEQKYINALAPLLTQNGFPAHFITDTCKSPSPLHPSNQLTSSQLETVFSQLLNRLGVTGATLSAPALASVPPPTQETLSQTLSSGSSPVESATVPPTRVLPASMPTVLFLMLSNLLHRPEPGSRLTSHSSSLTLTHRSKRRQVKKKSQVRRISNLLVCCWGFLVPNTQCIYCAYIFSPVHSSLLSIY